jgi:hypothetical protein
MWTTLQRLSHEILHLCFFTKEIYLIPRLQTSNHFKNVFRYEFAEIFQFKAYLAWWAPFRASIPGGGMEDSTGSLIWLSSVHANMFQCSSCLLACLLCKQSATLQTCLAPPLFLWGGGQVAYCRIGSSGWGGVGRGQPGNQIPWTEIKAFLIRLQLLLGVLDRFFWLKPRSEKYWHIRR